MSEGYIQKFVQDFQLRLFLTLLILGGVAVGALYLCITRFEAGSAFQIGAIIAVWLMTVVTVTSLLTRLLTKPMTHLAQAVLHLSPNEHLVDSPNLDDLQFGKELVSSLTRIIYDYAATVDQNTPKVNNQQSSLDDLPIAVIGVDASGTIASANTTAIERFGIEQGSGIQLTSQLKMQFTQQTLDEWLASARTTSVNSNKTWRKVDIQGMNETRSYYDLAVTFRQQHPSGIETLLVFFDHDELYQNEQDVMGLIALAVHEIRTPLSIMRGYVEALEEDMGSKLDAENAEYMKRLTTSAASLSTFISNILSVAKADQNQLNLPLVETDWKQAITDIATVLAPRAQVRGKQLQLAVTPNLPAVAADKVSLTEVMTNLIENAIKYSTDKGTNIWIEVTPDTDGYILTTIRDEGVGIPESVVPNLFTKFYRNHRNRTQIAGTGLGLFLSKAIVTAHKGNIWVKSKEGQGTTVGFTLLPFSRLDEAMKQGENGITRTSHGWIKNHSMQRR